MINQKYQTYTGYPDNRWKENCNDYAPSNKQYDEEFTGLGELF